MKPKVLLIDIENAPNIGYTWSKFETNVIQYTQDWYILMVSWKWLGKGLVTSALPDFSLYKKDPTNDREILKKVWKVLDEADIVIGHNAQKFDLRKINARFIHHGMPPPSPYKVVDTLKAARRYFQFDSNKLDDLGKYLHIGQKLDTGGFELFKGCMNGDKKCWEKMIKYNRQDVLLLEKLYHRLKPWIETHPIFSPTSDNLKECPLCKSSRIQSRGTQFLTGGREHRKYQCMGCGKWLYGKTTIRTKH